MVLRDREGDLPALGSQAEGGQRDAMLVERVPVERPDDQQLHQGWKWVLMDLDGRLYIRGF